MVDGWRTGSNNERQIWGACVLCYSGSDGGRRLVFGLVAGWEELLLAGFGRVGDGLVMVKGGACVLDLVVFLCFLCLDFRWRDLVRWAKGV